MTAVVLYLLDICRSVRSIPGVGHHGPARVERRSRMLELQAKQQTDRLVRWCHSPSAFSFPYRVLSPPTNPSVKSTPPTGPLDPYANMSGDLDKAVPPANSRLPAAPYSDCGSVWSSSSSEPPITG
jgi:hypothetical protein